MSSVVQKIIGIDHAELGLDYPLVRDTSIRADPDVIVICNSSMDETDHKFAATAVQSGHVVYLVQDKTQAPEITEWLQVPLA
jgi:Tfp pilus assembly pilus retraction ATPase PilT